MCSVTSGSKFSGLPLAAFDIVFHAWIVFAFKFSLPSRVQDGEDVNATTAPQPAVQNVAFAQILSRLDAMNTLMQEEREERRALSTQVQEVSARLNQQSRRARLVLPLAKHATASELDEKELAEKLDRASPHSNPEESSEILQRVRSGMVHCYEFICDISDCLCPRQ